MMMMMRRRRVVVVVVMKMMMESKGGGVPRAVVSTGLSTFFHAQQRECKKVLEGVDRWPKLYLFVRYGSLTYIHTTHSKYITVFPFISAPLYNCPWHQ